MSENRKLNLGEQLLYPLCCLIGVVITTLKLAGVIDWSWIAVLAPFWIIPVFVLLASAIILLVVGVLFLFACVLDYLNRRKR